MCLLKRNNQRKIEMFEIIGNIEFRIENGIVSYAHCLETNKFYDFKKANHYYRMYK